MPSLTVEDRTATWRPTGSITLPDLPESITLHELIRLRVREEVARYNLKPVEIARDDAWARPGHDPLLVHSVGVWLRIGTRTLRVPSVRGTP